jgi:hypothetical protein
VEQPARDNADLQRKYLYMDVNIGRPLIFLEEFMPKKTHYKVKKLVFLQKYYFVNNFFHLIND